MSAAWSWVLAGTFCMTTVAATVRPRQAWLAIIVHQVLWVWYVFDTRQWGFLVATAFYSLAFLAAFVAANKDGTEFKPSLPFN